MKTRMLLITGVIMSVGNIYPMDRDEAAVKQTLRRFYEAVKKGRVTILGTKRDSSCSGKAPLSPGGTAPKFGFDKKKE